uniref:Uncharacterized protein n=1 Tax=Siphoviridae sp. ct7FW4 TaxID=2826303 RepID=A0A8S5MB95_9CAUD|nr:MAG TPA: hypothetical protein [Siphoviridae sp. ct7FW4]
MSGNKNVPQEVPVPMGQTKINFSYIVAESEQDCNEKNYFSVD